MKLNLLAILLIFNIVNISLGQDLGIEYTKYAAGYNLKTGTIYNEFKITNYGPAVLKKGDVIYAGTRINGQYYNLSLFAGATAITLKNDLGVGESFIQNPGNLDVQATLDFLQIENFENCILVYGVGQACINTSFSCDPNPSNNISCIMCGNVSTGLEDNLIASKFKIYPNPAENELNIKFNSIDLNKVIIADLFGKTIIELPISTTDIETIDVSNFEKGLYICSIYSNNQLLENKKLVIK